MISTIFGLLRSVPTYPTGPLADGRWIVGPDDWPVTLHPSERPTHPSINPRQPMSARAIRLFQAGGLLRRA